jgi:hypothetical protein
MAERDEERVMPSAWLLVWTIYMVKFVMIFAIFWSAHSFQPMALVAATTWFWLGPALAIAASPPRFATGSTGFEDVGLIFCVQNGCWVMRGKRQAVQTRRV